MIISKQTAAYLEQLLESGLYGTTIEDVMERLICQQLQQLIRDKILQAPNLLAPATGPRCPLCGSPKVNDISGMGQVEFQCLDCNRNFTP